MTRAFAGGGEVSCEPFANACAGGVLKTFTSLIKAQTLTLFLFIDGNAAISGP